MSRGRTRTAERHAQPAPPAGTSSLLQNMSCAPRAQIQHRSPFRRQAGRGVVFEIPPGLNLLAQLLGPSGPGTLPFSSDEDAERELRDRLDGHARTLPFPAATLVTDRAEPEDEHCRDSLSIAAVLAKSSGRVYLRDKVPNLNQIKPGRRVILIVPGERQRQ